MPALTCRLFPLLLAATMLSACGPPSREIQILTGGDPSQGPALLASHGCIACHTVDDVPNARGHVGPPLDGVGGRSYIAGRLENTPDNMIRLIRDARSAVPGTAMPSLGVSEQDARDITAYLYTLR